MKETLSNARAHDRHRYATDMDLLEHPLDFLQEDHLRTRTICATLDKLLDADLPRREDVLDVLSYLQNELPLFIVDEDADLDRLLRRHAAAAPELPAILDRVNDLHREIAFRSRPVIDLLELIKQGARPLTQSEQDCLRMLARSLRSDMAVENAKLLPLAKTLLTDADLAELRSAMFQRRLSAFRDHRV